MTKIIQIVSLPEGERNNPGVAALADDGTVWVLSLAGAPNWFSLPKLPQTTQETADGQEAS